MGIKLTPKEARMSKGISQAEMAAKLGISENALANKENPERPERFYIDEAAGFAKACGYPMDLIIFFEDSAT